MSVPERWPTASERPHYALLTFGVGGRICSGRHAVTAIVTSVLAELARGWRLELVTDPDTVEWRALSTGGEILPARPVLARLHERHARGS